MNFDAKVDRVFALLCKPNRYSDLLDTTVIKNMYLLLKPIRLPAFALDYTSLASQAILLPSVTADTALRDDSGKSKRGPSKHLEP